MSIGQKKASMSKSPEELPDEEVCVKSRFQDVKSYAGRTLRKYFRPLVDEYATIHVPAEELNDEAERQKILPVLEAISNANRINLLQPWAFLIVELAVIAASLLSAAIFNYFAEQIAASGMITFWSVVMMLPLMTSVAVPLAFVLMSRHNARAGRLLAQLKDVRLAAALLDVRRDLTCLSG